MRTILCYTNISILFINFSGFFSDVGIPFSDDVRYMKNIFNMWEINCTRVCVFSET